MTTGGPALRVLQVDSGREWRGGQNQVRLLCRELARTPGVAVRLVTQQHSELARRAAAAGVPVTPLAWALNLDPRAWWGLRRSIRAMRPHLIHAHDSPALTLSRAALWGLRPVPIVATRRVDFHVTGRSAWHRADRLIAISDAVRRVLVADGFAPDQVAVVPDGIDPDEVRTDATHPLDIRRRLGLPAGARLAVNVAALVEHKDQDTLVRAAQAARTRRADLHWVIAGEGPLRGSLQAQIERLGLRDRVHMVGYIEEANTLIAEADVFVLSSREEGMGSVILNALALAKPVVATNAGGIPEILPADALVPVGDAAALAAQVTAALDHPRLTPLPGRCTAASMAAAVLAQYRSLT